MEILQQHVIPAVKAAGDLDERYLYDLEVKSVPLLTSALADLHHTENLADKAEKARVLRLETMVEIRQYVDSAEAVVPAHLWPLATYKDLLFLDQTLP